MGSYSKEALTRDYWLNAARAGVFRELFIGTNRFMQWMWLEFGALAGFLPGTPAKFRKPEITLHSKSIATQ